MKNNKRISTYRKITAAFFALTIVVFASSCGQELGNKAEHENSTTSNSPIVSFVPTVTPEEFSETSEPFRFEDYNLILNNNSHLFHQNNCEAVYEISPTNRKGFNGTPEEAIALGYEPCDICSSEWEVTPEPVIATAEETHILNTNIIKNQISLEPVTTTEPEVVTVGETYILNTNTHKFHKTTCTSVDQMADKNKQISTESRSYIISMGYEPCKKCNP